MENETVELALQLADKLETEQDDSLWVYNQLKAYPKLLREVIFIWAENNREEAIKLLGKAKFKSMMGVK